MEPVKEEASCMGPELSKELEFVHEGIATGAWPTWRVADWHEQRINVAAAMTVKRNQRRGWLGSGMVIRRAVR